MNSGAVFKQETQVVRVNAGRRGPIGPQGDQGDEGPQGDSYVLRGNWISGQVYCPLDGVTSRSSLVSGIQSLWLQKSSVSCGPSLIEPHLDTARWSEVGYTEWGDTFGGTWEVTQINHGFTMVGQPVAYSGNAGRYVLANPRNLDTVGIALVREVISLDRVVLQSTGMIPDIDKRVIFPGNANWTHGGVYYVSSAVGMLSLTPPTDNTFYSNPILKTAQVISGVQSGIALPWAPVQTAFNFLLVTNTKFYFQGPGSTVSGADLNGNLLLYTPGDATEVFVNGLNLLPAQYTAINGTSITFTVPLVASDKVEIWTPAFPVELLVAATTIKLDNIESQFNGVNTQFALTYGGLPVVAQEVTSVMVYLDTNPQEPGVDYVLVPSVDPQYVDIDFFSPPVAGTRFWGIALSPAGEAGLPVGGATGNILAKASGANGDVEWINVINGGTY